jgi:hypothetical protein
MAGTDDTSEDARRHLDELLRRMTPAEKMKRVLELTRVARGLALSRMAEADPDASEAELRRRLALELLPPDLARIMRERLGLAERRDRGADGAGEIE